MIEVEISEDVDSEEWNKRVLQVAEGSYRQTSFYGAFKQTVKETGLYATAVDERGEVVGQLLFVSGSPFAWGLERRPFSKITLPLVRKLFPRFYWLEGPLVFVDERREEVCSALIDGVLAEARVRGSPSISGSMSFYTADPGVHTALHRRICERAGLRARQRSTIMVDLTHDHEDLWRGVKREARTKVRRAGRDGIEIVALDGSDDTLRMAHSVMCETAARNRVSPLPLADFRRSFRHHQSVGLEEAFLSMHDGVPLSFQQALCYNGNVLLGGVSYSDHSREKRLYGNDLMQWHMIEWAKERGHRWLDYGGAVPDSADAKMRSIYDFKAKWGGRLIHYDQFELTQKSSGLVSRIGSLLRETPR